MALRAGERRPSPRWSKPVHVGQGGAPEAWPHSRQVNGVPGGVQGLQGARRWCGIPFLIWPGFVFSRLLGLLPLRYVPRTPRLAKRQQGQQQGAERGDHLDVNLLAPSRPWVPLCAAVAVASVYALWLQGQRFVDVVQNPNTTLSNYIYEVPMLFNILIAVVCAAYSLVGARNMAISWHATLVTLAELDAINRAPPSTSRWCRPFESWVFFLLVWFNIAMMVSTHVLYTFNHEYISTPWDNASVLLMRLVPLAVESQYLLSCLLLQRAYRALALCFRAAARGYFPGDQAEALLDAPFGGPRGGPLGAALADPTTSSWDAGKPSWAPAAAGPWSSRHALLARLRVLHQRVFQQVEDLTAHFGPQLLFKLVQTRIQLITDAFSLVGVLTSPPNEDGDGDEEYLAFYALEVCFLAYRLFCVVYRSEKVLQQDQVLVQLVCLVDPTSWDHASNQQLQLLRRQVRALRAQLHTCSMFTLNYDLLLAVAATTTTYLVVLVQFQPKSQVPS